MLRCPPVLRSHLTNLHNLQPRHICSSIFNSPQKLSKEKEALKGDVARLERELQQERQERKAAVAAASAAAQAQVSRL